ncbi:hypothetical protein C2G38_2165722 [Gigaspora rosea]|uniref:Uncharacterized protein n=1 Tax=Gigaspora rosea TaxID=44941 RepID=A0A397VU81_9GLOM|nr:hypothetical protein C2G38_2165722 [Gigaspora rosea]
MSLQNRIQHTTNSPWAYNSLNILQYDELFEVSPQMQKIVDEELHNYLDNLLNLLSQEKSSSTNTIDVLAASIGIKITNMKEKAVEEEIIKADNLLVFRLYSCDNESSLNSTYISRISITQRRVIDQGINIPDIYIPDPVNINSNSIANIEKILLHIETITGIKRTRNWVAVTCDDVPYHHALKLKEKFPWLVLILGPLHEEMNMLQALVELN